MKFDFNDRKVKRIAKSAWVDFLSNQKQYHSDMRKVPNVSALDLLSYGVKVLPHVYLYPKERTQEALESFVQSIFKIEQIKNNCSLETVYICTKRELETELSFSYESDLKRDFEEVLESLFDRIRSHIASYDFYFPLKGISLIDVPKVKLGSVTILRFDREIMGEVLAQCKREDDYENITEFTEKNFLGRTCITCKCSGDNTLSKKLAERKIRETINYLRCLLCVLFHDRVYENSFRINVVFESYIDSNQVLARRHPCGSMSAHWDETRTPSQEFPMDLERLAELSEKFYLDKFVEILDNDKPTELEGCALTAIYWLGQAQDEFDYDISFFKFWTSLECIFSHSKVKESKVKETTTAILAKSIPLLFAYGGYHFIRKEDIGDVKKTVKRLYDKRSKIVHTGLRENVSENELSEICKYSVWALLGLMQLISDGCINFESLDTRIDNWNKMSQTSHPNLS